MASRFQTSASVICMKLLLMIFNILLWIAGVLLFAAGIWIRVSLSVYLELANNSTNTVSYVLISTGAAIIIISLLACCCTVKGQPILLYLFSIFLSLIFALEIAAAVSGYMFRNNIVSGFTVGLKNSITQYGHSSLSDQNIDSMQTALGCCGSHNYTDWYSTAWAAGEEVVPKSCCNSTVCKKQKAVSDLDLVYHEGCFEKVVKFMDKNFSIITAGALGIAFFQILGIVLSCCLASHVNKNKYEQVD